MANNPRALGMRALAMANFDHQIILNFFASHGLPFCVVEYKFHPTRKFRFDYCFITEKIAVEQEGGIWTNGRHTRGTGYQNDMVKYNLAATLGFTVLRFTPQSILTIEAIETIKAAIAAKQLQPELKTATVTNIKGVNSRLKALDSIEQQIKRLAHAVETLKTTGTI